MICTDEGAHALLLCADGGVVYYQAPTEHTNGTAAGESKKKKEDGEEEEGSAGTDCGSSSGSMRGSGAGSLVELPHLFRQKDLQQHTGSWALRRVGLQGLVVRIKNHTSPARFIFTLPFCRPYFISVCMYVGITESVPGGRHVRCGGGGGSPAGGAPAC